VSTDAPVTLSIPAADGLHLAADGYGPEAAPAIFLAHGGAQCRHVWADTARFLAAGGHRAVTLDLRGHGDSDRARPPRYDPWDFARDFGAAARWWRTAHGHAPHFVGASLSGAAGLIAAGLLSTDVFASLTLVDSTPRINTGALDKAKHIFAQGIEEGFATMEQAARVAALPPERARVEQLMREGADGRWRWRWDPALVGLFHHNDEVRRQCEEAARHLTMPAHLIRAELSDFVDDATTAALLALAPHVQVTIMPQARHVVTGDPEGRYARAILAFVANPPRFR